MIYYVLIIHIVVFLRLDLEKIRLIESHRHSSMFFLMLRFW